MANELKVHDPRGYPPRVDGKSLAPRLETLQGKVVYMVHIPFDNAEPFMHQLADVWAERLPGSEVRVLPEKVFGGFSQEVRDEIVSNGDAAIVGLGL